MYKKLAAACSAVALAILGVFSGAAPASAVGLATYCFEFPTGEKYLNLPVSVQVYDNNAWTIIRNTTTDATDGCVGHIFAEEHWHLYSVATAHAVDRLGRTWYGTTQVGQPGLDPGRFYGVVYCYATNCP